MKILLSYGVYCQWLWDLVYCLFPAIRAAATAFKREERSRLLLYQGVKRRKDTGEQADQIRLKRTNKVVIIVHFFHLVCLVQVLHAKNVSILHNETRCCYCWLIWVLLLSRSSGENWICLLCNWYECWISWYRNNRCHQWTKMPFLEQEARVSNTHFQWMSGLWSRFGIYETYYFPTKAFSMSKIQQWEDHY